VGQALEPVGVFFSGVAFIGIALTLFLQGRELQNQREELTITREEQQRSSEIALRQLHTDLIKMAISDRELREVWPPITPGVAETKKDHGAARRPGDADDDAARRGKRSHQLSRRPLAGCHTRPVQRRDGDGRGRRLVAPGVTLPEPVA
jgi:Family of unknown function (DUF6082)